MTLASSFAVTGASDYWARNGFFAPRRTARPADGMWFVGDIVAGYGYFSMAGVYLSGGDASMYFIGDPDYFTPDSGSIPAIAMSPGGSMEALSFAMRGDADRGPIRAYASAADDSGPIVVDRTAPGLPGTGAMLGAGFVAENSALDRALVVYFDEGLLEHRAVEFEYSTGNPAIVSAVKITMPAGMIPAGVGFAARSGAFYYLSISEAGGAARTFRWAAADPTAEPAELPGGASLVAALHDGRLLSSDGLVTTVMDAEGAPLFAFPSGSLRFVHERWDSAAAAWLAVFSRSIFIENQNEDGGDLRVEAYEIPSASLETLAM